MSGPGQYKKYPGGNYCCVVDCHQKQGRDEVKFFCFPSRDPEQRKKWIRAINRIEIKDGKKIPWTPSKNSIVCAAHFVSGQPSRTRISPDFFPTIFPTHHVKAKTSSDQARLSRALKFRRASGSGGNTSMNLDAEISNINEENQITTCSIGCQTDPNEYSSSGLIFLSALKGGNAETQADCPQKSEDKSTSTFVKMLKDVGFQTDYVPPRYLPFKMNFKKLQTEDDYKAICGVSSMFFQQLVLVLQEVVETRAGTIEDKIMLFLVKLRHNLSFVFLAKLFDIHRTTASDFFNCVLDSLYVEATKWTFWLPREKVQATMPKAFKDLHPNARGIMDASEVKCEIPSDIVAQNFMFSQYKGSVTMKYLVVIAPSGFIMFISRAYGGRVTDSQITVDSGFLELLEPGDLILADKGFPKIVEQANVRGAFALLPPFKRGERPFSSQENTDGYNCSKLRIHVERAIARMKVFKILKFLDHSLLPKINKILLCIAYIVNHFPPLIVDKD